MHRLPDDTTLASSLSASLWSGMAATKFRAPRQRRDLAPRQALLQRAQAYAMDRRVTLVCAPAGFGKSTLLLQLATSLAPQAECVWLSLDEEDNDINRLFVALLGALRGVQLEWEVDPHILASQIQEAGPQTRAAVAALVNALASHRGGRLLLILDDLHRLSDPDTLQLLGELIERLPPEQGVVLGSRAEPALPVARWRARGEVAELLMADLQFSAEDAQSLAVARQATGPAAALSAEVLAQALQRTQGWAAGLQLVLGASDSHAVEAMRPAVDRAASRHLFDFFAQEVLADLPADLGEFALQCSVLPELSPPLCNAVTLRDDAARVLDELYRRNLFLIALDESEPVLRFHDLFAEFLQARLEQRHPGLARTLHARAAQAEAMPLRAVSHWLKAGAWSEAIQLMGRCVEPLLAQGGQATVARWIAQLPAAIVRGDADVARLQGLCAWARWDFASAIDSLEHAAQGYRAQGRTDAFIRCTILLPRACNAIGRLEQAERVLAEIDALNAELPPALQAIRHGARAWQATALRPEHCAAELQALADIAEQDPGLLLPAIDDMFNPFIFGAPGTQLQTRRLRALCQRALLEGHAHWQIEAMANAAWPDLLHGERALAEAAVERQRQLTERLSMVPILALNDNTMRGWVAALRGDFAAAKDLHARNLEIFGSKGAEGLKATWYRSVQFCLAQVCWKAGDMAGLQALWPALAQARGANEWPFVDTALELTRGRLALAAGRLDEAEQALREALRMQACWSSPTLIGDVRPTLAAVQLARADTRAAWESFAPLWQTLVDEDCLGPLLMEPVALLQELLALLPQALRQQPGSQLLLQRLGEWYPDASRQPRDSRLAVLSEREREVLACIAAGDSNKLIARALDLSMHTVKRHVANILTKLDCSSRGQAAAAWRAAQ